MFYYHYHHPSLNLNYQTLQQQQLSYYNNKLIIQKSLWSRPKENIILEKTMNIEN